MKLLADIALLNDLNRKVGVRELYQENGYSTMVDLQTSDAREDNWTIIS